MFFPLNDILSELMFAATLIIFLCWDLSFACGRFFPNSTQYHEKGGTELHYCVYSQAYTFSCNVSCYVLA